MPFLPAFLLMAHAAQTVRVELPIHNRRPSSLVTGAKALGATVVADDERGVVSINGTPSQVDAARDYLKLMDLPRPSLLIRVTVVSPTDHLTWGVDAHLVSGQKWRTSDDETASEIVLVPHVDGSGALTAEVGGRCHGVDFTSSVRLLKGKSQTMTFGPRTVQKVEVDAKGDATVSDARSLLPTVTIEYVGR